MLSCQTDTVTVRTMESLFDTRTRRTLRAPARGQVRDYIPSDWRDDAFLSVMLNSLPLTGDRLSLRTRPGDEVLIARVPGFEPISWGTLFTMLAISLVLAGVSYGITALTAPTQKSVKGGPEDSATYGFDAFVNTVRPGTRIPIVYGTHRIAGHLIQQFTRPSRDTVEVEAGPQTGEMHTLIGLCTGPIEGIDDVRFDRNPARDFPGVTLDTRLGRVHQAPIDGFSDVVTQRPKDVTVLNVDPPVTFVTENEVDAFEVVFRFVGGLYKLTSGGGFKQKTIELKIEHREFGTDTWLETGVGVKRITAATRNAFDSWFESPRLARAVYEIRISRITHDDTSATGFSDVSVLTVNEVLEEALSYPQLALLAVRQLPTNQVSGRAPQYDCRVRGKLVRVYTSLTTYTTEWSDNPAWCLLDLLTNPFDGLGPWISDEKIDLQSFIDWAAFCDLHVPIDLRGGTQRQFRLNIVLDGTLSALDAIKQIAATGRAFFLLRGDKWAVRPDKLEEPVQLFTMGRISQDSFSVVRQGRADIGNFLVAQFWNEELDYEQDTLPKEDPTLDVTDEQIEASVNLMGTTDPHQANRLLNYHMLTNRLTRRVIEMGVGVEALAMEAGDVFLLAHDVPGWGESGKLVDVDTTGTSLQLDRVVTIEPGKTYELTVIHDTDHIDVVEVVTSQTGPTRRIAVSGDFQMMPFPGMDYSFGETSRSTVAYRCTSITKGPGFLRRIVRARQYDPAVFGDDLSVLPLPSISRLPDPGRLLPDVTNLRALERITYAEDGTLAAAIDVHFTMATAPGARAQVFWRTVGEEGWLAAGGAVEHGHFAIVDNVQTPGTHYEISVVSVSPSGMRKHPDQGVRTTLLTEGTTRQPGKVSNFRVDRTVTGLIFTWDALDPVLNFDLEKYELRSGPVWRTAIKIGETTDTVFETAIFTKGTQTFLLKAINTSGNESAEPAIVTAIIEARIGENIVFTRQEDSAWPGTLQSFVVDGSNLTINTEDIRAAWRARMDIPIFGAGLIPGGRGVSFRLTAAYTTAPFMVTAGNAVRALVGHELLVDQIDTGAYWTAPDVGDKNWESEYARTRSWALAPEGRVVVRVEMRFSTSGSNDSDFGPWQERPSNIEVTMKWAQARLIVEIADPAFTVQVSKFRIHFDVPEITAAGSVVTSAAGTVAVVYPTFYNNPPKITAIALGLLQGDDVRVGPPTASGFDVDVINGAVRQVRTINWHSVGF
jgi:predicted phage tail protein